MPYSPPPTRKGVSCFVGAFCSFLALFSFWALTSSVLDLIKLSGTSKWHAVDGVVVSSQVRPGCKNLSNYLPSVSYQYAVERREYLGHRIEIGAGACRSKSEATRIASAYPEGQTVRVYFDPEAPDESALDVSRPAQGTIPVITFALVVFGITFPVARHNIRLCTAPRAGDA